jgi:U3 small nucleolar RNA-associated protein 21
MFVSRHTDKLPKTDTDFLEHLKSLGPSAADLELRSLSMGFGDDESNELLHFIRALTSRLIARRDYELIQAWMTVFLRLHFDLVMANESLLAALGEWKQHQGKERERLDDLVGYCGGVVGFLRSPRT